MNSRGPVPEGLANTESFPSLLAELWALVWCCSSVYQRSPHMALQSKT
eukprot:CAMPEP_0204516784 /NCGR_PEP_ID=MMETSP0661-20131031/3324_1 /ASSEMBLY_ACC=CAM_ASM_000606 /TAXON_ID=109239 /ORGANISM="Alexandrium margalefi, Strain AMGDE01CS-322" /LENGTH=47 /DNA_ID= /DNA_START= /DNA_END= /DNA_ORIENTATION=